MPGAKPVPFDMFASLGWTGVHDDVVDLVHRWLRWEMELKHDFRIKLHELGEYDFDHSGFTQVEPRVL